MQTIVHAQLFAIKGSNAGGKAKEQTAGVHSNSKQVYIGHIRTEKFIGQSQSVASI